MRAQRFYALSDGVLWFFGSKARRDEACRRDGCKTRPPTYAQSTVVTRLTAREARKYMKPYDMIYDAEDEVFVRV